MLHTIGFKIFAIALIFLFLMIVIAVISTLRITWVNDEIVTVAEYYIPLTILITNIQRQARDQEIQLERMLRLYEDKPLDIIAITSEGKLFNEKGDKVDQEVNNAFSLVIKGIKNVTKEIDRLEFTRLEVRLKGIKKEHQDMHEHALRVLEELEKGRKELAHQLEEMFRKEREDFDREISNIYNELQQFTESSSVDAAKHERQAKRLNAVITIAAAILGLVLASIITGALVRPVRRLLDGTKAVEQGNLDITIHVPSRDEIGMLTQSFNHMVDQLRVKDRIKDTFGKYIDPRIVENMITNPESMKTGGERRIVTVFFSDIEKFSAISENMTPSGLVTLINHYFTLAADPIRHHRGVIDKYLGDGMMAFWGPPFTSEHEHAKLACFAALDQFAKLGEFRHSLPDLMGLRKGLPEINIRVGLATGEVIVGNIGSDTTRSYTVMGDTVNIASRLEGANKQYGTRLLISEQTQAMAGDAIETRELDSIRVVGKSEPVRVFELLARKGALAQAAADLRESFERGLKAYRDHDWDRAQTYFAACIEINPEDGPAKLFTARVKHLQAQSPPEHWDGVWVLTEK